eukprot:m.36549 g.36549  ORF g.36549 m.36549 type:complete len:57 (-) comp14499_c0_seq1:217-387(-)
MALSTSYNTIQDGFEEIIEVQDFPRCTMGRVLFTEMSTMIQSEDSVLLQAVRAMAW